MFALHHVICQTLVRVCGTPHAETNAAILPRAMAFMASRAPNQLSSLAAAIGTEPAEIEARILELGGEPPGLGESAAIGRSSIRRSMRSSPPRARLHPRASRCSELRQLIESAW